ncbi:hypothetical protein ACOSP7_024986 [Xanthoceras sorbifolium]
MGYYGSVHVDCEGKSGGLILLWKEDLEVTILSMSMGHIDANVKEGNGRYWRFTEFYGNSNLNLRGNSWDLIRRLKLVNRLPWICGGDFNEILHLNEKVSGFSQWWMIVSYVILGVIVIFLTWNNKRLESELEQLFAREELYWKQRARVDWLMAGDRNSKFFHAKAMARRQRNSINSLIDENGVR